MPIEPPWLAEALTPQDDDSADLRWALESAAAEWTLGDKDKTLKWLIHASAVASSEGHTDRAGALADAAEELAVLNVRRAQSEPPNSRPPGSTREFAVPLPPLPADLMLPDLDERPTRLSGSNTPLMTDPPYAVRAPSELPERPTNPVLALAGDDASTHAEVPAPELLEASSASSQPYPTPHAIAQAGGGFEPSLDTSIGTAETPPSSGGPAPTLESDTLLEPMRALRVAVVVGGRQSALILLAEGELPPPGAQLALLIPLGPGQA